MERLEDILSIILLLNIVVKVGDAVTTWIGIKQTNVFEGNQKMEYLMLTYGTETAIVVTTLFTIAVFASVYVISKYIEFEDYRRLFYGSLILIFGYTLIDMYIIVVTNIMIILT